MHARGLGSLLVLWGSLVAFSTLDRPGDAPLPFQRSAVAAPPASFKHDQHVQRGWTDPSTLEVWRDCRGCHRFDANHVVSSPQQQCAACHGPGLALDTTRGAQQNLDFYRTRTRDAFRHHTHAMLECRQCHGGATELFADFEIRTGPGLCTKCHAPGRAKLSEFRFFAGVVNGEPGKADELAKAMGLPGKFEPPTDATFAAYATKLVECFAGPTGGINTHPLKVGGEFDHGDHLGIGIECVDCHTNIEGATATDIGTGQIPLAKCGDCHVRDASKAPVRQAPGQKSRPRPLSSLGTFAHKDHFAFRGGAKKPGVCTEAAYGPLANVAKACETCHTYAPAVVGIPGCDFPFEKGKSKNRYLDCVGCHDVAGWKTGETERAPLHVSTGGGPTGGWDRCSACHVLGQPDMAKVRPAVDLARFAARTFQFPANVHPDVTSGAPIRNDKDGKALSDCKDCHRAKVPALATRLAQKVFRHDTHLPENSGSPNCAECHPSTASSKTSASLAEDGKRTYGLANCAKCHVGGEVVETDVAAEAPKKSCVEFPHAAHVGNAAFGKAGVLAEGCLACHVPAAAGRVDTKPGALLCNQCHDHKAGQPGEPKYEGLFDGGAASCARCHRGPTAGTPGSVPPIGAGAKDPRYETVQSAFVGFADSQFHPLGAQCTECHKANVKAGGGQNQVAVIEPILLPVRDHVFGTIGQRVHQGQTKKQPAACLRCHWKPVDGLEANVRSAEGAPDEKKFRLSPSSTETRAKFGNQWQGYPGTEAAGG